MSLYGNIKRIGSSTFQFDKVYPNRVAMDTADDVIYVGRYVLVEYGERYRQEGSERIQNEEYTQNQNIDLTTYGNVYDSTVWQRVYLTTSDNEQKPKYIMVAELNALAPKLELEEIAPLTATLSSSGEVQNLYYDEDAEASGIQGTPFTNISSIERNIPVFDEKQDTELTYKLKMPTPLELNVNDNLNYHQDRIDLLHSIAPKDNITKDQIGWIPKDKDNIVISSTNTSGTADIYKQELFMNLPSLGDTISDLYDVLFGKAAEDGGIRPYFVSEGITSEEEANEITVDSILANNSEGLAGILKSIFADTTLPGSIRYYIASDWIAKNTSNTSNTPGVLNKPKVVFSTESSDLTQNKHYNIDYTSWRLTSIYRPIIKGLLKAVLTDFEEKIPTNMYGISEGDYNYNLEVADSNQKVLKLIYNKNTASKKEITLNIDENNMLEYYTQRDGTTHCWVGVKLVPTDDADNHYDFSIKWENDEDTSNIGSYYDEETNIIWLPLDAAENITDSLVTITLTSESVSTPVEVIVKSNINTSSIASSAVSTSEYNTITYNGVNNDSSASTYLPETTVYKVPKNGYHTIAEFTSSRTLSGTCSVAAEIDIVTDAENGIYYFSQPSTASTGNISFTSGSITWTSAYAQEWTDGVNEYTPNQKIQITTSGTTELSASTATTETVAGTYDVKYPTVTGTSSTNFVKRTSAVTTLHAGVENNNNTSSISYYKYTPFTEWSSIANYSTYTNTAVTPSYGTASYSTTGSTADKIVLTNDKTMFGYSDADYLFEISAWKDTSGTQYTLNNDTGVTITDMPDSDYTAVWTPWNTITYTGGGVTTTTPYKNNYTYLYTGNDYNYSVINTNSAITSAGLDFNEVITLYPVLGENEYWLDETSASDHPIEISYYTTQLDYTLNAWEINNNLYGLNTQLSNFNGNILASASYTTSLSSAVNKVGYGVTYLDNLPIKYSSSREVNSVHEFIISGSLRSYLGYSTAGLYTTSPPRIKTSATITDYYEPISININNNTISSAITNSSEYFNVFNSSIVSSSDTAIINYADTTSSFTTVERLSYHGFTRNGTIPGAVIVLENGQQQNSVLLSWSGTSGTLSGYPSQQNSTFTLCLPQDLYNT